MNRLWLCLVALGGAIAFISCDSQIGNPDGGTGMDGSGPKGGTGGGGHGGGAGTAADGTGPSGGRGGTGGCPPGYGCDGTGAIAGRGGGGGTGGCPSWGCDGIGPIAGRGGTGGTGGAQPCDGLIYFTQRGLCASTYAAQAAKQVSGNCDYVRVFTGTCGGQQVWTTRYQGLGDPVTCAYDNAGNLAGARTCTDTPVPQWNCNGAATSPSCLNVGMSPDLNTCTLTTTCDGGRGGGDGAGPIGGHGGGS